MLNRLAIWFVEKILQRNLSLDDRNRIIVHLMDNLQSLPISSIITTNEEGEILLNGSSLDIEKIRLLRESARIALDNPALKIINQEVLFIAVTGGLHKAVTPEDLYFYRAAIWFGQQLESQLKILAQRTDESTY